MLIFCFWFCLVGCLLVGSVCVVCLVVVGCLFVVWLCVLFNMIWLAWCYYVDLVGCLVWFVCALFD